ncbi:MAG TPA: DUF2207 domain-containing protein [Vicinamibacterales bacterium]|nr:DUF2207 domain-containing protein [Vicinamibacterales bacterium]HPW21479.1 DUF2207 domain-containing protein [Vicinamibacterales bacterium]
MPVRRLVALSAALAALPVSLLVGLLVGARPASASRPSRAEQFDVRILVEPGGSIRVTETMRFSFGPKPLTSVRREVARHRTDGWTVAEATMDGVPLARGTKAGQFEWRREDKGKRQIVWHFKPASNSVHTFTVTYVAAGVAWQDAGSDVLAWPLVPSARAYDIECASGEVEFPASATLLGTPGLTPPASQMQVGERRVSFTRCPLEPNRSWIVTLRFAPGTLLASPPAWQAKANRGRAHLPLFLGLAAMMLVGGVGGFTAFALGHRAASGGDADRRLQMPPDDLPPALAGALQRPAAAAGWSDLLGAVMDLGRRGVIHIEAKPSSGVFRQHDATLSRGDAPSGLLAHEQALLDIFFTDKSGPRSSVTFSQIARSVSSARRWKRLQAAVSEDLREARLLDPERERTRGRVIGLGAAILALAFVGFILSIAFIERAGEPVLALPIAALIVGITGIVTGAHLSPLSEEAIGRAERWRAYRRYLADSSTRAGTAARSFERVLPYAAAFGLALGWAKRLQNLGVTDGPSWMVAAAKDGTAVPANIGDVVAVLSAGSRAGNRAGRSGAGAAYAGGAG